MPIYMRFGSVTGESRTTDHERWIEINSVQWGVGRGISSSTGSSADREGTVPSVSEITVTKPSRYSLTNVEIINTVVPPRPSPHRQPRPHQPRAPVPPWLRYVLARLRLYLRPTGTIHLSGFLFDEKELSALAGVPVRELP